MALKTEESIRARYKMTIVYRAQEGFVNLESAWQSKIDLNEPLAGLCSKAILRPQPFSFTTTKISKDNN